MRQTIELEYNTLSLGQIQRLVEDIAQNEDIDPGTRLRALTALRGWKADEQPKETRITELWKELTC